ncbi:cell division protein YceG involved in septum cleavage [Anoxybacillus tepidamans]|uniref:Cell division protein YceG involved in septum cleavage n=1 Tax=Anoxybacteroides tepidamans TaxID=265948 RepID=A0A7W8IQ64_9BACL|nr:endolytic transglycosylase MltG [Anoxybacillus tepidamans]MBB5324713.1 cell division protein YceG involved in septum cleavage [Anoxybacillus tepidamans]
MNKSIVRAFALGMLLSTSIIGAVYYNQLPTFTKSQLDAYLKKNEQIILSKNEYQTLKEAAEKAAKTSHSSAVTVPPKPKTIYIYHLVVKKGDVPAKFAKELEEANIIADAKALTNYLNAHSLTRAIRPGTYEIRSDMKYEEIAHILTNKKS